MRFLLISLLVTLAATAAFAQAAAPAPVLLEPGDLRIDCAPFNAVPACPAPAAPAQPADGGRAGGRRDKCTDPPNLSQDYEGKVRDVFAEVSRAAGLPQAVLNYDPGVHRECRDVGVAALNESLYDDAPIPPTVHICASIFQKWAADRGTIFFVLAHELGHLRNQDSTKRRDFGQDFLARWFKSKPAAFLAESNQARAEKELNSALCPAVIDFARGQEDAADLFATRLMRDAGCDPEAGAKAVQQQWDYLTSIGRDQERRSHSSTRDRMERIRQAGMKRQADFSGQLSAPGFQ